MKWIPETVKLHETVDMKKKRDYNNDLDEMAKAALIGLLSSGSTHTYDTSHQAYTIAKMMLDIRNKYHD
jgi:hypothetical protein